MKLSAIKVGIIGANAARGWAAATHLPVIAALEDFDLTAVCTTRAESAEQAAQRYGARHAFTDARQLVALDSVDLVVVSVRAYHHVENVKFAVAAGKHVLCEWPLGRNSAESAGLLELANRRGVRHFVGLQGHAAAALLHARALIDADYVGDILSADMHGAFLPWGSTTPPGNDYVIDAANGATLASIPGGHALDMLCALLGDFAQVSGIVARRRTEAVSSTTGRILPMTSPDQMLVVGTLRSGVPVTVHIQGGGPSREEFSIDVRGTAGALRLQGPTIPEIMPLQLSGTREHGGALAPIEIPVSCYTIPVALRGGPAENVGQLYMQLGADLRDGTHRAPDFARSLARRRLLDAIETASKTGQRQTVE